MAKRKPAKPEVLAARRRKRRAARWKKRYREDLDFKAKEIARRPVRYRNGRESDPDFMQLKNARRRLKDAEAARARKVLAADFPADEVSGPEEWKRIQEDGKGILTEEGIRKALKRLDVSVFPSRTAAGEAYRMLAEEYGGGGLEGRKWYLIGYGKYRRLESPNGKVEDE